ncbi:MAG: HDOD domain-containing protein [Gammaproteobacteria bacterium]|nr:HDOD domain-containing protein [Gammaproteobacteria bacterium]
MSLERLLREELKNLPPLPGSIPKIQAICYNSEASIGDLVAVVERDPLLTANILRLANSSFYGFSGQIGSIHHAISMFGKSTIFGFAISGSVRNSFVIDLEPYGVSEEQFSAAASMRSSLLFHWYRRHNRPLLEQMGPAAFLADIGKILTAKVIRREKREGEFLRRIEGDEPLEGVEREFCGQSSDEISALLLEQWGLPPPLCQLLRGSLGDDRPEVLSLRVVRIVIPLNNTMSAEGEAQALSLLQQAGVATAPFTDALQVVTE